MSFKRLGLSYIDPEPRKAQQDRDAVAAVQDLQGVEVAVTSPSVADKEFAVVHNSQIVPRAVEVLFRSKGGVVYASREADWDKRRIFVKCTTTDTRLLLRVR